MKCLFLAAGYATRLYPLTENFPKPLLPVGGKTILDYLIDDLKQSGLIDEFVVISNHKFAHHFDQWAQSREENITVLDDGTESNETRLGAVRDIAFAMERLQLDCDLLVAAGDNLLTFSLNTLIQYAKEKDASCVLRYWEKERARLLKCGVAEIDANDLVLELTEKSPHPKTNWCCPPFYFYHRRDLPLVKKSIEEGCPVDAPGSFAAYLAKNSTLYAMQMPGRRMDIGTLADYERVQKEYETC